MEDSEAKEWRQLRRQMDKLDFEPVPEIPTLIPRTYYTDEIGSSDSNSVGTDTEFIDDHLQENKSLKYHSSDIIEFDSTKGTQDLAQTAYEHEIPRNSLNSMNTLSDVLKKSHDAIHNSVLAKVTEITKQLAESYCIQAKEINTRHQSAVQLLQNQVNELKNQLEKNFHTMQIQQDFFDKFSVYCSSKITRVKDMYCNPYGTRSCFKMWVVYSLKKKKIIRLNLAADEHYRRKILRRFLQRLRKNAYLLKEKANFDKQEALQLQWTKAQEMNEQQIEELQKKLEESQSEITATRNAHKQLEEDMRKIFLRGISTMNIEALTAFQTSFHQQNLVAHQLSGVRLNVGDEMRTSGEVVVDDSKRGHDIPINIASIQQINTSATNNHDDIPPHKSNDISDDAEKRSERALSHHTTYNFRSYSRVSGQSNCLRKSSRSNLRSAEIVSDIQAQTQLRSSTKNRALQAKVLNLW